MNMNDEDRAGRGALEWVRDLGDGRRVQPPEWITARLLRNALLALLAIVAIANTAFQIKPEEVGLVLRFGRNVRTTEPGLHFKFPFVERPAAVSARAEVGAWDVSPARVTCARAGVS